MGETRVDLLRLLEDLRDAYPGSIEETIVTEIVANALDSGARTIDLITDPEAGTFTAIDDGKAMGRPSLSRYHDLAVTSKTRGRSIGFAGVGIKLGLLISDDIVTETRSARAKRPLATSWRLVSRSRAPWRWIEPPGILGATGTAVRLYLTNALSRLVDSGFVETTLLRHFEPLFHAERFDPVLAPQYADGITFRVNGRVVPGFATPEDPAPIEIRVGRQRKPSGVGFLVRFAELGEDERGIAVSTLGKVIKRGWDWLGLSPAQGETVAGLVEIPALAEALTLNKADFVRTGPRGATFLAYRKALQEAVSMQLEAWGDSPEVTPRSKRRTRRLERDLRSVLADLSEQYPLLATLVERRPGGQRRLPLSGEPSPRGRTPGAGPDLVLPDGVPGAMISGAAIRGAGEAEAGERDDSSGGDGAGGDGASDAGAGDGEAGGNRHESGLPGRKTARKPARYGLRVRFEARPDAAELGRLVETTVWVNELHPAYGRAVASRSEGYHVALAVAMALADLAVEPVQAQAFVAEFLACWGEAGANGAASGEGRVRR